MFSAKMSDYSDTNIRGDRCVLIRPLNERLVSETKLNLYFIILIQKKKEIQLAWGFSIGFFLDLKWQKEETLNWPD